jgi:hypothetical protein
VETRCDEHATPLYPQKLALTSPTIRGPLFGVARLRTKSHGVCSLYHKFYVEEHTSNTPTTATFNNLSKSEMCHVLTYHIHP